MCVLYDIWYIYMIHTNIYIYIYIFIYYIYEINKYIYI